MEGRFVWEAIGKIIANFPLVFYMPLHAVNCRYFAIRKPCYINDMYIKITYKIQHFQSLVVNIV